MAACWAGGDAASTQSVEKIEATIKNPMTPAIARARKSMKVARATTKGRNGFVIMSAVMKKTKNPIAPNIMMETVSHAQMNLAIWSAKEPVRESKPRKKPEVPETNSSAARSIA